MKTVEYEMLDIIDEVVKEMPSKYQSLDAVNLIYRTGMVETRYDHLQQDKGPAIGYFQIEPATIDDIIDNFVVQRRELVDLLDYFGFIWQNRHLSVLTNIGIQIVLCRLCYWRIPYPVPTSLEGQAYYWKQYYNTPQGRGTEQKFIEVNNA